MKSRRIGTRVSGCSRDSVSRSIPKRPFAYARNAPSGSRLPRGSAGIVASERVLSRGPILPSCAAPRWSARAVRGRLPWPAPHAPCWQLASSRAAVPTPSSCWTRVSRPRRRWSRPIWTSFGPCAGTPTAVYWPGSTPTRQPSGTSSRASRSAGFIDQGAAASMRATRRAVSR